VIAPFGLRAAMAPEHEHAAYQAVVPAISPAVRRDARRYTAEPPSL